MPPNTADSYEAKALDYAASMLAASATFRTLVGAATSAEARAFIIEQVGDPANGNVWNVDDTSLAFAAPLAVIREDGAVERTEVALRTYQPTGSIIIYLLTARGSAHEWDALRGARNTAGAIRAEIEALVGSDGYLAEAEVSLTAPALAEDTDPEIGEIISVITINWRG